MYQATSVFEIAVSPLRDLVFRIRCPRIVIRGVDETQYGKRDVVSLRPIVLVHHYTSANAEPATGDNVYYRPLPHVL